MNQDCEQDAQALYWQLYQGDPKAWPGIHALIMNRFEPAFNERFANLETVAKVEVWKRCGDLLTGLWRRNKLDPGLDTDFSAFCVDAIRRILVELSRRLLEFRGTPTYNELEAALGTKFENAEAEMVDMMTLNAVLNRIAKKDLAAANCFARRHILGMTLMEISEEEGRTMNQVRYDLDKVMDVLNSVFAERRGR